MIIKRITLLYLIVFIIVTAQYSTVSFAYPAPSSNIEAITQYIIGISNDINEAMGEPEGYIVSDSRGEMKLKLLLSPKGELRDVYVSESSGNKNLDRICLRVAFELDRFKPFPVQLGDEELWLDVPVIFVASSPKKELSIEEELQGLEKGYWDIKEDYVEGKKSEFMTFLPENLHIGQAVDIALENHLAADIAKEEIELSELKIREARRALYPTASLNYMETIGQTTGTTQDFTDKEYKIKFEHPLYYGWRLKYAVSQARSNMKASKENYDKVLQDLRVDVETAFYSYIVKSINLKEQRELLKDAKGIFDMAKKRFDLGLSTKTEFLQVHSQMRQIAYQVSSSENELDMAKLSLAQAMNVGDSEHLDNALIVDELTYLEAIEVDVTSKQCMDLAFDYRPDFKAKKHIVDFNDYEQKIARSKDQFKVDLSGTYGKSGGAYETETLELDNDWYLGLKVTKPLGGNTVSAAYTEDKTSEKHGQSTRTESMSQSVEIGILDNLQSFSEKKSASIGLNKAKAELKKIKDVIVREIKDAYYGYKKGLIQSRANLDKVRYREEELRVAKARAGLNEIPYSALLQARISLTDEKSFYIEAVGSLYQALAKLNRATGYSLFLDDGSFRLASHLKP